MSLSSILGRKAGNPALTVDEMLDLAAKAWRRPGCEWAVIHLPSVRDDFDRQAVINAANAQHGRRK